MTAAGRLALILLVALAVGCRTAGPRPGPESAPVAQLDGSASLTIRVLGFDPPVGEAALALYDSADSFAERRDPVAKARLPIAGSEVVWNVGELTPGRYAVAAYHDADSDGELDRALAGWPTESYGFSNDARSLAGPPGFKAAAFNLVVGENQLEITVR